MKAIGSAEAGAACFTCITGEAWPDSDSEINEAVGLSPGRALELRRAGGLGLSRAPLSKTQVACAESLECAAVCGNDVRTDRFGGGDEPRIVLA
jgi:hypothetical protein